MKLLHKILAVAVVLVPALGLAACNSETTTTIEKSDDYQNITSEVTLTRTYTDKAFIANGISLATVTTYTDGDTTTFKDSTGSSYTIRYYGIDTPESTTKVQKWGKAASIFTKNKLKNASDIIIMGTNGEDAPSKDSNNTRYLGYVWYRESSTDAFKLLNLELMENGFTKDFSVDTSSEYYDYFLRARNFAKEYSVRLWGTDEDEYYNEPPIETTLQEIVTDLKSDSPTLYDSETTVGKRVSFEAYIKDRTTSGSIYYFIAEAVGDDGGLYTMTLLAGYSSETFVDVAKIGFLYKFVGAISTYGNSYQIAIGGTYDATKSTDDVVDADYTELIQKDYYIVFNSSNSLISKTTQTAVYTNLTVTSVSLSGTTLTIVGTAYETNKSDSNSQTFTITVTLSEYTGYDETKLKAGTEMSCGGYQYTYGTYELVMLESTLSAYLTK